MRSDIKIFQGGGFTRGVRRDSPATDISAPRLEEHHDPVAVVGNKVVGWHEKGSQDLPAYSQEA